MAFYKCGGGGIDTSMVDATAEDVKSLKTIVDANGQPLVGTMKDNGAVSITLSAGGVYTIPVGYHNGGGKVSAKTLASQTSATATADKIEEGYTAYVNGEKIIGTKKISNTSISRRWHQEEDLPDDGGFMDTVVVKNELYILMRHKRYDYIAKLYKWDKNSHTFTYIDELNINRNENWRTIIPYMDGFVMFSGTPGGWGYDYFFRWDGAAWTQLDTKTIPFRSIATAKAFGNKLHIFGTSTSTSTDVREAWHHYIWDGSLWMEIPTDRPPFIGAETCIRCNNSIYVWRKYDPETWRWDGTSWEKMRKSLYLENSDRGKLVAKEDGKKIWFLAEEFSTGRYGLASKCCYVDGSGWYSDFLLPFLNDTGGLTLKPVIENNTLHLIGYRHYYISDSQISSDAISYSLEHWTMPLS